MAAKLALWPEPRASLHCLHSEPSPRPPRLPPGLCKPGLPAAGQMRQRTEPRGATPTGDPAAPAISSKPAGWGHGAPPSPLQPPGPRGHHSGARAHSRPHRQDPL